MPYKRFLLAAFPLAILGSSSFATSLDTLDKIAAGKGTLGHFLADPEAKEKYLKALKAYVHRDRFRCENFDAIIEKTKNLIAKIPEAEARLWKPSTNAKITIPQKEKGKTVNYTFTSPRRAFHALFADPATRGCLSDKCTENDAHSPDRWVAALENAQTYFVEKDGIFIDMTVHLIPVKVGQEIQGLVTYTGGPFLKKSNLIEKFLSKTKHPWAKLVWYDEGSGKDEETLKVAKQKAFPKKKTTIVDLKVPEPMADKIGDALPRRCLAGEGGTNGENLLIGVGPTVKDRGYAISLTGLPYDYNASSPQSVQGAFANLTPQQAQALMSQLTPDDQKKTESTIKRITIENPGAANSLQNFRSASASPSRIPAGLVPIGNGMYASKNYPIPITDNTIGNAIRQNNYVPLDTMKDYIGKNISNSNLPQDMANYIMNSPFRQNGAWAAYDRPKKDQQQQFIEKLERALKANQPTCGAAKSAWLEKFWEFFGIPEACARGRERGHGRGIHGEADDEARAEAPGEECRSFADGTPGQNIQPQVVRARARMNAHEEWVRDDSQACRWFAREGDKLTELLQEGDLVKGQELGKTSPNDIECTYILGRSGEPYKVSCVYCNKLNRHQRRVADVRTKAQTESDAIDRAEFIQEVFGDEMMAELAYHHEHDVNEKEAAKRDEVVKAAENVIAESKSAVEASTAGAGSGLIACTTVIPNKPIPGNGPLAHEATVKCWNAANVKSVDTSQEQREKQCESAATTCANTCGLAPITEQDMQGYCQKAPNQAYYSEMCEGIAKVAGMNWNACQVAINYFKKGDIKEKIDGCAAPDKQSARQPSTF